MTVYCLGLYVKNLESKQTSVIKTVVSIKKKTATLKGFLSQYFWTTYYELLILHYGLMTVLRKEMEGQLGVFIVRYNYVKSVDL